MKKTFCGLIICLMLVCATAPGLKTSAGGLPVTILWQQDLSGYVKIANLTGSRLPDVVVGAGGTIYAFDGRGKALWNLTGLQEVSTLEVGDINNDGLDDVLALTGTGFSRGPDGFVSANATLCAINSSGTLLWERFLSGVYSGGGQQVIAIGDINGDGRNEIAVDGFQRVIVFDGLGNELWTYGVNWFGAHIGNIRMGDLDGSGIDDVVVTYWNDIYSGGVLALNGTGNVLWNYHTQAGMKALAVADLNNDGKSEVVASSYQTLGAMQGIYLLSNSGSLVWYRPYANETNSIAIGDIVGDGINDIVAGTDLGDIFVLNGNGTIIWSTNFSDTPISGVAIGDFVGSGKKNEVVACGSYFSINPSRQDGVWMFDNEGNIIREFSGPINFFSLASADLNGDGIDDVVVSTVDLENMVPANTYALTARVSIPARVTTMTANSTWAYQGQLVTVNVTVSNFGDSPEQLWVTLYSNITMNRSIGAYPIHLDAGQDCAFLFIWNTTGTPPLNYTLTAVSTVPTGSDTLTNGTVAVRLSGDVNGDGRVDLKDLALIARAFGSSPTSPNWNPNADINGDGVVNMKDITLVARDLGQHYP